MIGPEAPHRLSSQVLLGSQMLKRIKYVLVMLGTSQAQLPYFPPPFAFFCQDNATRERQEERRGLG